MKNTVKTTTTASARFAATVESLVDKSTRLAARLIDAQQAAETARAARTEKLADASEAELDALIAGVANAEAQTAALRSIIAEVERQLIEARANHAQALESERRAAEADALDKAAVMVKSRLEAVAKAADAFKSAIGDLESAIPQGLAIWPSWSRPIGAAAYGPAVAKDVISALVAEISYSTFPAAFTWSNWQATANLYDLSLSRLKLPDIRHRQEGRKPVSPAEAGERLILDRLGELAAELRAGGEAEKFRRNPEPRSTPKADEIAVVVHSAFRYRVLPPDQAGFNAPQFATIEAHQVHALPELVALAAVAAGHAERLDTAAAREKAEAYAAEQAKVQNSWKTDADQVADIGDPLDVENTFQPRAPRLVA